MEMYPPENRLDQSSREQRWLGDLPRHHDRLSLPHLDTPLGGCIRPHGGRETCPSRSHPPKVKHVAAKGSKGSPASWESFSGC